jgi:hypothetical protein
LAFAQFDAHLPLTTFRLCVAGYDREREVKSFSCLEQLLVIVFA